MALPSRGVRRLANAVSAIGSGWSSGATARTAAKEAKRISGLPAPPSAARRIGVHAPHPAGRPVTPMGSVLNGRRAAARPSARLPRPPSGPRRIGVHRPAAAGVKPMPMGDVLRMNKIATGGSGMAGASRSAGASGREAWRISKLPAPPSKRHPLSSRTKKIAAAWGVGMVGSTAVAARIGNNKNSAKGNGQLPGSQTGIYGM